MKCSCGFVFSGPGQFRNCEAFITDKGDSGVTCPECQASYVNGEEIRIAREPYDEEREAQEKATYMPKKEKS